MSERNAAIAPVNPYMAFILAQGAVLEYAVRHDSLTGALNKEALKGDMQEQMDAGIPIGLALCDLDAFKAINDEFGHERGDAILIGLVDHLQANLRRPSDEVAFERSYVTDMSDRANEVPLSRLGGDEFAISFQFGDRAKPDGLLPHQRAIRYMAHLRTLFKDFVETQDPEVQELGFDISVGFALFHPDKPVPVGELFKEADKFMYAAKRDRKASRD